MYVHTYVRAYICTYVSTYMHVYAFVIPYDHDCDYTLCWPVCGPLLDRHRHQYFSHVFTDHICKSDQLIPLLPYGHMGYILLGMGERGNDPCGWGDRCITIWNSQCCDWELWDNFVLS